MRTRARPLLLVAGLAAASAACASPAVVAPVGRGERCDQVRALPAGNDVLLLGDSTFRSNQASCGDVGDFLSLLLGARVVDRAGSGLPLVAANGQSIGARYRPGPWSWVVIAGGQSDLASCACTAPQSCECTCDGSVSELIDADTRAGAMVELVDRAHADGAHVALLGYYDLAKQSALRDIGCDDEQETLRRRYAQLAVRLPGVYFVDGRSAISPESAPTAYQADGTHPAPEGAERLARALYDAMSRRVGSGE